MVRHGKDQTGDMQGEVGPIEVSCRQGHGPTWVRLGGRMLECTHIHMYIHYICSLGYYTYFLCMLGNIRNCICGYVDMNAKMSRDR